MYAIISALDPESSEYVRSLWDALAAECGLQGIYHFPTPHFSWFGTENLAVKRVEPILSQIAESQSPIRVHVYGLGVFTGTHPVLYLAVVKSQALMDYHREIWDQTQPYSQNTKLYYSPALWLPHVTLAIQDLTAANLPCAVETLLARSISLTVRVDNVMIVMQEDQKPGETLARFSFTGKG